MKHILITAIIVILMAYFTFPTGTITKGGQVIDNGVICRYEITGPVGLSGIMFRDKYEAEFILEPVDQGIDVSDVVLAIQVISPDGKIQGMEFVNFTDHFVDGSFKRRGVLVSSLPRFREWPMQRESVVFIGVGLGSPVMGSSMTE